MNTHPSDRLRKGKGIMLGLIVCMAITIVGGSLIRPTVAGARGRITLTFGAENEFAGFDAIQVRGFAICDAIANHAIQERLFDADDNGNLIPVLGLSATASADQTVWTVTLRQGVFFHDKTPFNADAVVAHWQRLLDPANRFRGRSTFAPLLSVEKEDAYTVRFNLKHPWLPFPQVLTETRMLGTYIPSPTAVDAGTQLRAPVGTGPFMFKTWTAGDRFEVVRNPNYWGEVRGNLETIVFKFIPDEQTRYASLKSGQMQMIWMDRGTIIRQADADPSVRHYQCDGDGAEIFVLNTSRPPLDDKRVRQALAMAWNQSACVKISYHDAIPEATAPFGSAIDCGGAGYPAHNLEKARALIAQYGQPVTIECLHSDSRRGREQGELLQQFGKRIGITVNLVGLSFGPVIKKVLTKDYQVSTWRMPPAVDQGPLLFRAFHSQSRANVCGYKNPQMDQLLLAQRMETDPDRRASLLCEIARLINADVPVIYRGGRRYHVLADPGVKAVEDFRNGIVVLSQLHLDR